MNARLLTTATLASVIAGMLPAWAADPQLLNLIMPDATLSFTEFGLVPVTATTHFINNGPTTGTLNLTTGAIPGACIRYEITVTNIGSTPVTGVVINDATPANTLASNGAAKFTSQGTLTVPADGAAGPVSANLGILGPGASATIRFNVRINP